MVVFAHSLHCTPAFCLLATPYIDSHDVRSIVMNALMRPASCVHLL